MTNKSKIGGGSIIRYLYGIDLSMTCTGVSIFDLDSAELIYVGSIKTRSKETHGERLNDIREYMSDLMTKYPPFKIAIEQGFTMHNRSTQVIYRVHGICNELFHEYEQIYYAPTTVKKAITGNGRASKDLVQEYILDKFPGIELKNEDESDAVGVAVTHLIKKNKIKW